MRRVSLRVRLAALIGVMLVICGAALLTISYELVSSNLSAPLPSNAPATSGTQRSIGKGGVSERPGNIVRASGAVTGPKAAEQSALRKRTLDQLVTQYLAVLAGVVLVAVALGWLLAGRLLRSVRRITRVAERVTGRNLDERIGLEGPRDELRELADAFDAMLARLDDLFSAQRRFVADASHELRTPLTAMRAEVEVLVADPDAASADVQAATLVLRRQLARSEELIEALLALARSEPELLISEAVDLAQLSRQALEDAAMDAAARRLRIDHQLGRAIVHGDQRLLTLLAGNLLGNAIKHNRDDGWIELRTAVQAGSAVLVVANSGSVVTTDEVRHITQAFRRGGRARVGDGHGLGLALVAAVARAHRGTIAIEPRAEGGLQVEVGLPLATRVARDPTTNQDANGTSGKDVPTAAHGA